MRIRRSHSTTIRSRRKFGFDPCCCGITQLPVLLCRIITNGIGSTGSSSSKTNGSKRCFHHSIRKLGVSLVLLVGVGLTTLTTLLLLVPSVSQQQLYVNWETSLLNTIPLVSKATTAATAAIPRRGTQRDETTTLTGRSRTTAGTAGSTSSYDATFNATTTPDIIIRYDDWKGMERIVDKIWGGSLFCTTIQERLQLFYNEWNVTQMAVAAAAAAAQQQQQQQQNQPNMRLKQRRYMQQPPSSSSSSSSPPIPNILVHFEFSCLDLYKYSRHGTGNYIQAIYFMRLAVKYIPNVNIKLNVTCTEQNSPEFYTNYILPWFTGVWYTPTDRISRIMEHIRIVLHTQRYQSFSIPYENYCGSFKFNPTAIMYKEMQHDVRRMAIALVGTQPYIHDDNDNDNDIGNTNGRSISAMRKQSNQKEIQLFVNEHIYERYESNQNYYFYDYYTTQVVGHSNNNNNGKIQQPTIHKSNVSLRPGTGQERIDPMTTNIVPLIALENIVFDDAVIHFRCGDLLSTDLLAYGFLTFHGYSRHISSHVRSIGILTQPFGNIAKLNTTTTPTAATKTTMTIESDSAIDQERSLDTRNSTNTQRCRTLVYAFQEYLQEKFPNATIHIRNDRTETIALAYARMVMAQEVVASMSTFGIYPVIGTFGTGYFLRPRKNDPSMWAIHPIYPLYKIWNSHTILFDEKNMLVGTQTSDMWNTYGDDVVLQWFRTGILPPTNDSKPRQLTVIDRIKRNWKLYF